MERLVLIVTLNFLFFTSIESAITILPYNSSVVFDVKGNFQLSCNVSSKPENFKWQKDGKDISSAKEGVKESVDGTNYYISIRKSTEEDAGKYTCIAIQGAQSYKADIDVSSRARVRIPDNINVVEGEKLKIVCNVAGNPPPSITWKAFDEVYDSSKGRVILKNDTEKNIPNSVLIIENIQMNDRGVFTCMGYINATNMTVEHECMVRIKDKYAALWPFLGICAEVFVLCAIILIYEKKRNKTELEESDTDQSPDQKNTPDHGKDTNLRHRQ